MQDPIAQEFTELLALVSDVKSRLRQLESAHIDATTGIGVKASPIDPGGLSRTRNHLELTMEALGRPSWGFAAAPASSLEITGFYSADIYKALRELRNPEVAASNSEERKIRGGNRRKQKARRKSDRLAAANESEQEEEDSDVVEVPGDASVSESDSTPGEDVTAVDVTDPADDEATDPADELAEPDQDLEDRSPDSDSHEPSIWVKHRVDEIQRALSAAFGDDDSLSAENSAPKPFASPEFVGNTDTLAVPELIGFFQVQCKTGVLTIDARHEQFTLEYLKGELIHAGSSSSPDGERLGEILVRLGHVTDARLQRLLAGKSAAERIGDALRRGDVIDETAIAEALQVQVQHIFHRLFDLGGCRFTFREGLEGEPRARVRYNVTRLLLETARHKDELERDDERLAS